MNFSKMNKKQLIDLNNKMSIDYLANVKPLIAKEEQRNPYYLVNGSDLHRVKQVTNSLNHNIGFDTKAIRNLSKPNLKLFYVPFAHDMDSADETRDEVRNSYNSITDIKKRFSNPSYEAKIKSLEKVTYDKNMKNIKPMAIVINRIIKSRTRAIKQNRELRLNHLNFAMKCWSRNNKDKFLTKDKTAIQAVLETSVINHGSAYGELDNRLIKQIAGTPQVQEFSKRIGNAEDAVGYDVSHTKAVEGYLKLYRLGAVPSLRDVDRQAISKAKTNGSNAMSERRKLTDQYEFRVPDSIDSSINNLIKMSQKSAQRTGDKSVAIDPEHAYRTPDEILKHYQVPKSIIEDVKRRNSPALTGSGVLAEYKKNRQQGTVKAMPGLPKIIHDARLEHEPLLHSYDLHHIKNGKPMYMAIAKKMKAGHQIDNKGVRKIIADGVNEDKYQHFNHRLSKLYSRDTPNNEAKVAKLEKSHPKWTAKRDHAVKSHVQQNSNKHSAKHTRQHSMSHNYGEQPTM